jgi:hypothetical protein
MKADVHIDKNRSQSMPQSIARNEKGARCLHRRDRQDLALASAAGRVNNIGRIETTQSAMIRRGGLSSRVVDGESGD